MYGKWTAQKEVRGQREQRAKRRKYGIKDLIENEDVFGERKINSAMNLLV